MNRKAVVIGSGVAGMASAIRLRVQGFEVHVVEANAYPGGKLSEFTVDGFRFDAGPSLFTLPELVDELFTLTGKDPRHYFNYKKLDVTCHYFFEDGTSLIAYADPKKLTEEIETKTGVPAQRVVDYLRQSGEIYSSASEIFLESSLHRWKTWLNLRVVKALSKLHRLGIFQTIHQRNVAWLQHDKLVQLFDRYATYNGSNPFRAPGILTSIPHLEFNRGAYLPDGGMHSITKALHHLAVDLGVHFSFNKTVTEIKVENGRATGVMIGSVPMATDIVICNMDVYYAFRKLMPSQRAPERTLKQERSSSALIFYWGIRNSFPQLDLHNILFSSNYEREFRAIFQERTIDDDPTVYVNITSKHVPSDAPAGCENWFVMINVPANTGQDWNTLISIARTNILKRLNRHLSVDLEKMIVTETVLDPLSIDRKTHSYQGSLYGTSSNSKFSAFLRHPNFSHHIKNLYFCGGSVHPGGGIPLALFSAKIVSSLVAEQNPRQTV